MISSSIENNKFPTMSGSRFCSKKDLQDIDAKLSDQNKRLKDTFERNFTIGDGETMDDRVPSFQRNTKSSLSRNKVISEERLQRS